MDNIKILKNYIDNNNGLLLTSNVVNMNIHKQYIKLLCDENYIVKLKKSVYAKPDKTVNDFFLLQQRYKKWRYYYDKKFNEFKSKNKQYSKRRKYISSGSNANLYV